MLSNVLKFSQYLRLGVLINEVLIKKKECNYSTTEDSQLKHDEKTLLLPKENNNVAGNYNRDDAGM